MIPAARWVELGGRRHRPRWDARLLALALTVAVLLGALSARLYQIQVLEGGSYGAAAHANHVRRMALPAERGVIYDRHGAVLAFNRPSWSLEVVPADLPAARTGRARVLRAAALLAGDDPGAYMAAVDAAAARDPYSPLVLRRPVGDVVAMSLRERLPELPGVSIGHGAQRAYADAPLFAHVVGYTGPVDAAEADRLRGKGYRADSGIGRSGIEAGLEDRLRGRDGSSEVETDARGVAGRVLRTVAPVPGAGVRLTLDAGLQRAVAGFLADGLQRAGAAAGAAVVVDARSGDVLAQVSLPGYDTNLFAAGLPSRVYGALLADPARPLVDRALAGQYPPGSTFKMVTAAAGLEEGRIGPETRLPCPASITYGGWTYANWAGYDMGPMNVGKALAVSCDTFFYSVADRVGDETLARYARAFGFGAAPEEQIPGAAAGIVPDRGWKAANCAAGDCRWNPGETLTMGIGQSYLLTSPVTEAMYAAAIANGGRLLSPNLVREVVDSGGAVAEQGSPRLVRNLPLRPATLATVRDGMRQCLTAPYGTGFLFRVGSERQDGGCKTGTAQYGGSGLDLPTHAWFVMFTPYDNPEIAMVVLAEGGGEGHQTAEPVAVRIADYYRTHRLEILG